MGLKQFFGLTLYYFFALFLYLLALPYILYLLTKPKYRQSLPGRFFPFANSRPVEGAIRFHTCSFGETASMREIASCYGDNVHFSVITNTGYEEAKKFAKDVSFLPYEIFLPFWENAPRLLMVAEAELWLLLFAVAKLKGAKTALINARISDKSYKSYKRFRWFYSFLFSFVDLVMAQSQKDATRLQELGAKNVVVTGNTKVSQLYATTKLYSKAQGDIVITAASTHFGEEELVFGAFCEAYMENMKLIIVPRHPERFTSVYEIIKNECAQKGYSFGRFSDAPTFENTVTVVDIMGELINIYAITDIAIICGSFANIGGHNPIEAARFGCKIITGPNIHNHTVTFEALSEYTLTQADELAGLLKHFEALPSSMVDEQKDPVNNAKRCIDELLSTK